MKWFIHCLEWVLDFFLPTLCLRCHERVHKKHTLCQKCYEKLDFVGPNICPVCGRKLEFFMPWDMTCASCLQRPPLYQKMRAACIYNEGIKSLILPFKHADRLEILPFFIEILKSNCAQVCQEADIFIPVPLHKKRLVKRGYNQASLIAQKLALEFNKVYLSHALVRIRYTPSQGHMSFEQRKKNVSGAFKVHGKFKDKLQGKSVLLIDDVITTCMYKRTFES